MNDRYFLDTNIVIYAHTDGDITKQKIAQNIISEKISIISTQVIQETVNTLTRKFMHPWGNVVRVINEAASNSELYLNSKQTITIACNIADKYQFSFYDSLIIAAALESDCNTLYSEDLHHNQIIENKLKILNPFLV